MSKVGRRLSFAARRGLFGTSGLPEVVKAQAVSSSGSVTFSRSLTALSWGPTQECVACCNASQTIVEVCVD